MEKSLSQKPVLVGSIIVGVEKHTSLGEYNEKNEDMIKRMFVVDDVYRKIDRNDPNITHAVSIARADGAGDKYLLAGEADGDAVKIRTDQPAKKLTPERDMELVSLDSYKVTGETLDEKELKYVCLRREIEENQRRYEGLVKELGEARLSDDEAGALQKRISEKLENMQALNWDTHMKLKEMSDLEVPQPESVYPEFVGIQPGMIICIEDQKPWLVLEKNPVSAERMLNEAYAAGKHGDVFTCMSLRGAEKPVFTSQNHQVNKDATISVPGNTKAFKVDMERVMIENISIDKLSRERIEIMKGSASDPHLCELVKDSALSLKDQLVARVLAVGVEPESINAFNRNELKSRAMDGNTAELIRHYPQITKSLSDIEAVAEKTIKTYGLDKDYGPGDITIEPSKEKSQQIVPGERPEKANSLSALLNRATAGVGKPKKESKEIKKDLGKGILKGE